MPVSHFGIASPMTLGGRLPSLEEILSCSGLGIIICRGGESTEGLGVGILSWVEPL